MKTLTQFLEEALRFAKNRDDDYFYGDKSFISLTKNGKSFYKLEGTTMDRDDHALKHLIEFDREIVYDTCDYVKRQIKQYIAQDKHDEDFQVSVYDSNGKKLEDDDLQDLIDKASDSAVLNYLDYINDKIQMKDKLTKFEYSLKPALKKLGDVYEQYVENVLNNSVDVDELDFDQAVNKFKKERKLNFAVTNYWNNKSYPIQVYVDCKKHAVVYINRKYNSVQTMYILNDSGVSRFDFLRALLKRRMNRAEFDNRNTVKAYIKALNDDNHNKN